MPKFNSGIPKLLEQTIMAYIQDRASRQAAALAYYGVLSLAPLLIIAISVAGIFLGRDDVQQQVISEVEQVIGSGSADLVQDVLEATYDRDGGFFATVVSVILLLFGATNLFSQLKMSLNRVWGVETEEGRAILHGILNVIRDRLIAALMVVGVGFLLLLSQMLTPAISVVISFASDLDVNIAFLLQILNMSISIALSAFIIGLVFRFLPDTRPAWRDVWVGALFTAVLFALGQRLIGLYIENSNMASAYGVAGSVIVVLLWIYYSSSIVLFGAEFTEVYARLYGMRSVDSEPQSAD
ncbi:MAG: YihY/virulence factor BrkB family protein [Chloroflexi bacterium]|nr:YihY/virulence factor BrkB family protein [Chloroflexota bacterium]